MQLLITCPYGLWSLLAHELKKLWFNPENTFQTWTFINTDMHGMMKINYWSRIANKVFIQLCKDEARTFDQLFDLIKNSSYSQYLSNTHIELKVQTKSSQLSSVRSIQSVAHKALLESIKNFGDEASRITELLLTLENNSATLYLNTSGTALHQRGYRKQTGDAPLKENLAVALLLLAGRRFKSPLIDPFCGSWTIAIEAALLAKNIAPGSWRKFAFEQFKNFENWSFQEIKTEAEKKIFDGNYKIFAYDYDPKMISLAKSNAETAKVEKYIHFEQKDFLKSELLSNESSRIITNPPYGKRLKIQDLEALYSKLKKSFTDALAGGWITSFPMQDMKKEFRKEKKLFNGNEKCSFWQKKVN